MNRWRLWLPLAVFAGFLALAGAMLMRPRDDVVASAMVGQPLPDFTLRPAVTDRPGLASRDLVGRPRLLNIFASWCVPCIAEAPQLARLAARGVVIDGIAIRDRPEDVARFLARYGNPYRAIGADDVSAVQLAIGSSGVPETFVIDPAGRIAYQHIGEIRAEDVDKLLKKLEEDGT
ncbi:MAG: redoxin family protein [Altererythrobacter sp.]|nr:redoxin family protein [Altererythrobacter sp.]